MFFFNDTAHTDIYTYCHTLSLHDALPIYEIQRNADPLEPDQGRTGRPGQADRQAPGLRAGPPDFRFGDRRYGQIGNPLQRKRPRARARHLAMELHVPARPDQRRGDRSEEHTCELQSLMRISYAVFRLTKQNSENAADGSDVV